MQLRDLIIFPAIAIVGTLAAWAIRRFAPAPFLVRRWANDNAFRIVSCEFRLFSRGPFGSRSLGKGSSVYRVHVRDQHGEPRIGWVLCIAEWGAGRTEVEWDAPGETAATRPLAGRR
jgi:hypothetical protein